MSIKFQTRNNKFTYYLSGHLRRLYPRFFVRSQLQKIEKAIDKIKNENISFSKRLDYYYQEDQKFSLHNDFASTYSFEDWRLSEIANIGFSDGVYSLDLFKYSRFFNPDNKIAYLFGDIIKSPEIPSLTKTRPLNHENSCSVLMKFDAIRHFRKFDDPFSFQEKENTLIWRGAVCQQPHRISFMENFFNKSKFINVGDTNKTKNPINKDWTVPYSPIPNQLKHKFILSIEGNDVATNTKWIMNSNSLLFMTKPKIESWLMEGKLIPGFHYVQVKDDYSNLEDLIEYFIKHIDEAEEIIKNANNYMKQFDNQDVEDWLQIKILEKYFKNSSQPI